MMLSTGKGLHKFGSSPAMLLFRTMGTRLMETESFLGSDLSESISSC